MPTRYTRSVLSDHERRARASLSNTTTLPSALRSALQRVSQALPWRSALYTCTRAQALLEYALAIALIAVVCIAVLGLTGAFSNKALDHAGDGITCGAAACGHPQNPPPPDPSAT